MNSAKIFVLFLKASRSRPCIMGYTGHFRAQTPSPSGSSMTEAFWSECLQRMGDPGIPYPEVDSYKQRGINALGWGWGNKTSHRP